MTSSKVLFDLAIYTLTVGVDRHYSLPSNQKNRGTLRGWAVHL
ncbi:hypothetical protein SLEP1_g5556 [Rubroshorea leprosula]|uniref:Uncharacterized protein n=1 Tax=Rubroshorea leprosula TaxID=152421 RepID=A0AAV5I0F3_9ROSI|nr:hypothetical protein SLEP1_g5556 [Rubroshorea leprosula]